MNYTKGEIAWYMGLILGTSAVFVLLEQAGVEPYWLRLVVAVIGGAGIGFVAQKQFPDDDDR